MKSNEIKLGFTWMLSFALIFMLILSSCAKPDGSKAITDNSIEDPTEEKTGNKVDSLLDILKKEPIVFAGEYIIPYSKNKRYWEYKGKPVLLLGGSKNDDLFLDEGLEDHLDDMVSVGANYIRNVMTGAAKNAYPFLRLEDGLYDLNEWNPEYWDRFEQLIKLCDERDIIVQIEIWDRFDYSAEAWLESPWHPKNNINYTLSETGLNNEYSEYPWRDKQPFFHTISGLPLYNKKLDIIKKYQELYVYKLLSHSLKYGNVLYVIDNETTTPLIWGSYWINLIRERAKGVPVYVTEMLDSFVKPEKCEPCKKIVSTPEEFKFIDISQVNRNFDQKHWDRLRWIVNLCEKYTPRPLNNTKIYGGLGKSWGSGTNADGIERFCRDIMGGCASVRHHRPDHGNGLNEKSKASIKAIRKIETIVQFWDMSPKMELLGSRDEDEAYLTAKVGETYVIYFTEGGDVTLDLSSCNADFKISWIDVSTGEWGDKTDIQGGTVVSITAPGDQGWFAVINKQQ